MGRFYNSYSRYEKIGLEYPQTEYEKSTVEIKVINWGPKWIPTAEIKWQADDIPYIVWRKIYQRKDGSSYCIFLNKRINVELPEE